MCKEVVWEHPDVMRQHLRSSDDDRGQRQLEKVRGYPLYASLLTTGISEEEEKKKEKEEEEEAYLIYAH